MTTAKPTHTRFRGFSGPNYTMVPDELFDELLVDLSGAELKVLLYIIRRTFGFKREADSISLSQMLHGITTRDGRVLDRGAGLSKPTLLSALRTLGERNIIHTERRRSAERGDEPTVYRLHMAAEEGGQNLIPPVVKEFDHGVVKRLHQGGGQGIEPGGWSKNLTTQETGSQETDQQQTGRSLSNIRKGTRPNLDIAEDDRALRDSEAGLSERRRRSSRFTRVSETLPLAGPVTNGTTAAARVPSVAPAEPATTYPDVHAVRSAPARGGARYSEERQVILAYPRDFAAEFGDRAPLKSSVTRALHLLQQSGLGIDAFVGKLYEARALTKERDAAIGYQGRAARRTGGYTARNKTPYFFALLQDVLGLREDPGGSERSESPPETQTAPESLPGASTGPSGDRSPTAAVDAALPEPGLPHPLPAAVDPAALWSAVREELAQTVTRPIFETYLRGAEHATAAGGQLVVHVPSDFAAEWLDRKLRPAILLTLARLAGQSVDVAFEVHDGTGSGSGTPHSPGGPAG